MKLKKKQKNRKQSNRPLFRLLVWLLVAVCAVGSSFGIASLWHRSQQNRISNEPEPVILITPEAYEITAPPTAKSQSPLSQRETDPGAVQIHPAVDNRYFADVLLIGDSISATIPTYFPTLETRVLAVPELTAENLLTKVLPGGQTIPQMLEQQATPTAIYLLLGCDGVQDQTVFLTAYGDVIGWLDEKYPEVPIYVQSIPPVVNPEAAAQINALNHELLELAKQKQVFFLDFAAVFPMVLPPTASADGVHFHAEYYYRWFAYIKTHTVSDF